MQRKGRQAVGSLLLAEVCVVVAQRVEHKRLLKGVATRHVALQGTFAPACSILEISQVGLHVRLSGKRIGVVQRRRVVKAGKELFLLSMRILLSQVAASETGIRGDELLEASLIDFPCVAFGL